MYWWQQEDFISCPFKLNLHFSCFSQHKSSSVFPVTTWCQGMRGFSPFTFHTGHNRVDGKVQHTTYVTLKKKKKGGVYWRCSGQMDDKSRICVTCQRTAKPQTVFWRYVVEVLSAAVTLTCDVNGGSFQLSACNWYHMSKSLSFFLPHFSAQFFP